jgi:hypothetical protein
VNKDASRGCTAAIRRCWQDAVQVHCFSPGGKFLVVSADAATNGRPLTLFAIV